MLNKIKISGIIGLLVFYVQTQINAQDVHFSQYYANPLYLNPSFAGSSVCPRLVANFRDQWPAISGTYTSYSASYDQHFDALSGGIGILFLGDRAASGTYSSNAISLIYAYKLDLSRKVAMRMALQATFQQTTLDWTKLRFPDMINPKYGFVYETQEQVKYKSKGLADFSAGLVIYSDKVYGGLSVNHFTQPKEGFVTEDDEFSRLPIKFTAHVGALLNLNKHRNKNTKRMGDMSISPNIIFQYQTKLSNGASYSTMNYGAYFNCYPLTVGLWLRNGFNNVDALIFLFGLEYDIFKIGYSYDMTLSLKGSGGSHEISTQFKLPCPVEQRRIRSLNCPSF
ncbi:MAG: PorP/SprF family type IX secretion system membrane protein [Bacteroidales bacterium]|nr:PorP/SprF family type IX secretion system membrane protein [Bacteroidales bacterium]MDD2687630.1 PorP/SprF family type IX secretion system membrane protein [Bacteroidales bacterium]MDD4044494.1 PorP/SprF family type IX secretion system membrane protein [Bacteroidales bacterium]MDD4581681.1 PorP/SprF family type IX secretion system membrane protein [Bacteroidales bacterium]